MNNDYEKYLLSHVEKRMIVPDLGECWLFTLKNDTGTGYVCCYHDGTNELVHRFAYKLWVGPLADDMLVCHKCDV